MRGERCHLNYSPVRDQILLVDHGAEPMTAVELTPEALLCVSEWALRGVIKRRKPNIAERVLRRLGFRVTQGEGAREIKTAQGTLRITVEHLV